MERKDLWVVLISRAPVSGMAAVSADEISFVIIQEEDFCLTREQQVNIWNDMDCRRRMSSWREHGR